MMRRLGITLGAAAVLAVPVLAGIPAPATAATAALGRPSAASAAARPDSFVGFFRIINHATGQCVDDSLHFGLRGFGCNGEIFQEWRIDALNSSGTLIRFQNLNTGGCIEENPGVGLEATFCDPSDPRQQWWASTIAIEGGREGWFHNVHVDGCMDDSAKHGLRLAPCSSDPFRDDLNQIFLTVEI